MYTYVCTYVDRLDRHTYLHMYTCIQRESVCCLLVLNSVTSTPQWIRQPEAAWGCVWCLCVSMYSDILGSLSLWVYFGWVCVSFRNASVRSDKSPISGPILVRGLRR